MTKVTSVDQKGIDLIKGFEGWSSRPYLCSAGIPTIGYGSTFYEDGTKVKMMDPSISKARGESLLKHTLNSFEKYVDSYCIDTISQNQFNSLTSFCYNIGPNALKNSTLIKKVNGDKNDKTIRDEFMKWVRAGGKVIKGLTIRRKAEADLYFS